MKSVVAVIIVAVLLSLGLWGIANLPKGNLTPIAEALYPEPTNYAVDQAGVFSTEQIAMLNAKLKAMDSDKHQFGVAVVKTTKPLDIEQYGIKLAEKWKVGYKGIDNGVIIIVATEDRKVRIEVGHGLEGEINDAIAGRILDNQMVPHLKQGKWYEAIVAGLDELSNRVK